MLETTRIYTYRIYQRGAGTQSCFNWPQGQETLTSAYQVGQEVIAEEKMPSWRRRVAKGLNATTVFAGTRIRLAHTPGHCDSRRWCNAVGSKAWAYEYVLGNLAGPDVAVPSSPSTIMDPIVEAQARSTFSKRARDRQGAFQGSKFIAELRDTLRGIRNPARAIRQGIDRWSRDARRIARRAANGRSLDNLSPRQGRAVTRALSDSWLETSFGWIPLASDVSDAGKALRRFDDREDRAAVSATVTAVTPPTIVYSSEATRNVSFRFEIHSYSEASVRFYGAVKVRASGPFLGAVAENFGFRIRDFVPAVWEAIPYSFLVDYFTNIGEVLDAWSLPRSDFAWVSRTYRNSNVRDGSRATVTKLSSNAWPLSNHSVIDSFAPSSTIISYNYVNRMQYLGSLAPPFRFKIPGFGSKWINIAALAAGRSLR